MTSGKRRLLGVVVLAAPIVLFGALALLGLRDVLFSPIGGLAVVLGVGRVLGLWAAAVLLLQPLVAGRLRLLDKLFGIDRVMAYHHIVALAALGLAFLHPLVVYGSSLKTAGPSGLHLWPEGIGTIVLVLLWLLVSTAGLRVFLGLGWERWRLIHAAGYLVGALVLIHVLAVQPQLRRGWKLGIIAVPAAAWVLAVPWRLWIRKAIVNRRGAFRVKGVREVARGVHELTLTSLSVNHSDSRTAGQFAFLGLRGEEHPFTIASAAGPSDEITFAIKAVGDFTSQLGTVIAGERAVVDGPFGRLSPARYPHLTHLVLLAGGIGITPLLAMIRTELVAGKTLPVTLVWSVKEAADIAYRDELAQLERDHIDFSVHYAVTHGTASAGEHAGFIDRDYLRSVCPPYAPGVHAFVCGPGPMMRAMRTHLTGIGYRSGAIHLERFSL